MIGGQVRGMGIWTVARLQSTVSRLREGDEDVLAHLSIRRGNSLRAFPSPFSVDGRLAIRRLVWSSAGTQGEGSTRRRAMSRW